MTPPPEAITALLRASSDIAIAGEVSVTVSCPTELVAWMDVLTYPDVVAWRATDSGRRFLQVSASHTGPPVHGTILVTLHADDHPHFWNAVVPGDLAVGTEQELTHLASLNREARGSDAYSLPDASHR